MRDRRALFFVGSSVVGFLLLLVADPGHRWVAIAIGITYALLAVASALDARTRDAAPPRYGERRH